MRCAAAALALVLAGAASAATAGTPASAAARSCAPGSTTPRAEAVGGSAGASASCLRSDAQLPRITRVGVAMTDAAGGWSITWSTALTAAPIALPIPVNASGEPVVCNVATVTMTGATGRCWYARTLPAAIVTLNGLVNYDVFGASAAGIAVQVLAIPKTQ